MNTENVEKQLEFSRALGQSISLEHAKRIMHLCNDPLFAKDLAIDGKQVLEFLGCKPGKIVGQAIAFLLEEVLIDTSKNTPDELKKLLISFGLSNEMIVSIKC